MTRSFQLTTGIRVLAADDPYGVIHYKVTRDSDNKTLAEDSCKNWVEFEGKHLETLVQIKEGKIKL